MHKFLKLFSLYIVFLFSNLFGVTIEIKDFFGTQSFDTPVKKVIISGTYLELPAVLGIWDKVVGLDEYAFRIDVNQINNPYLENIYKINSATLGNIEKILQLSPDIIISSTRSVQNINFGKKFGLKYLSFQTYRITEVKEQLSIMASLFGKTQKIKITIGEMDKIFKIIAQQTKNIQKKKRVIFMFHKPNVISGKESIVGDMLRYAATENIGEKYIEYDRAEVSIETIVNENPDIIFIWWLSPYSVDDILHIPALKSVNAIKNKQVYKMPSFDGTGPRVALMSLFVAKTAYSDYFKNTDIDHILQNFYLNVFGFYPKDYRF
ncbi:hypothetical protein BKH41_00620 [Helicobacter sp. 12S02232-10]|uniref:ABC transporter substrate-binding protein n=1 Tax=Helicobacter sp. 12S02232-10 TaxID=1476197 RepID=UPI000BD5E243|nr:ABC transporter substrate-binding protein [Helicobacter sp. 12S02232-10]PAF49840.1 hypothetical protein BKH41_00620 [Helicobacter sp. 12S02232-10]